MLLFNIGEDKMSLWSQTSVFRVLSPFGNSVPNFPYRYWYTLYLQSCQCLSLSTSAIKKITTFQIVFGQSQIILDHLFSSFSKDYVVQIPVQTIGYYFLQNYLCSASHHQLITPAVHVDLGQFS